MRPGAVRRVEDMRRPSGRVVSRWSVHEPTKREKKKNASSSVCSRDPINRLSGISRRAPPRGRRGLQRLQMRAMVLAACRTLGPIVPMAAGRAGTRGAGRTQRGRGGGGGSSRGGAGGGRGGRGRAPPSRGEAAGQTGGVGAPSPRWGWDQRADAASEARRGVSTSRGPPRRPLPGKRRCRVVVGFFGVTRRSACRSSWRGAGCAADARPRSSSAEAWSPWKVRWRSRATRRCRTRA